MKVPRDHVSFTATFVDGRLKASTPFSKAVASMKLGDGEEVVVRIARPEDAAQHRQFKHLFGHILTPVSEHTGYTVTELKAEAKARWLPDGLVSLTEMNAEQFAEFNRTAEMYYRAELPDAFIGYERGAA